MLQPQRPPQNGIAWIDNRITEPGAGITTARGLAVREWADRPRPTGLSFYAPDFALKQLQPWLIGEPLTMADFQAQPKKSWPELEHSTPPLQREFLALHAEILERINRNEFRKVVPAVSEELSFKDPLSAAIFSDLWRREFPSQCFYGFDFEQQGMAGVTPELLFSVRDGVLQTMALAGTGRCDGPNLLLDPKERLEHQLVIDHIVGELKPWGSAELGTTIEREYGILKHLYTPIRLRLNQPVGFLQLVHSLHPTAALGGWPRQSALQWMAQQNFNSVRQRFGAPFGFIDRGIDGKVDGDEMTCVVAIRGMQWSGQRARLTAGCGVVKGSVAENEWNELALKRRAITQFLGMP